MNNMTLRPRNTASNLHGPNGCAAHLPRGNKTDEVALTTSPTSYNGAELGDVTSHLKHTTTIPDVTPKTAVDTIIVEASPSIRDKILAARKAPEDVAKLIASQTEQLTVPIFKRPPDGVFWRVRSGGEWDPQLSELLLLPRKDGGGGPEFLLVMPELEPLFSNDSRLRNLGKYYHLAFIADSRGRVGWWAVPSRSDNDWHISARTAMRRLMGEWGMMKSDQGGKGYKLEKPIDNLGEPMWPAGSYEDWYLKGLSDKLIDTPDHPVLRELQGRK